MGLLGARVKLGIPTHLSPQVKSRKTPVNWIGPKLQLQRYRYYFGERSKQEYLSNFNMTVKDTKDNTEKILNLPKNDIVNYRKSQTQSGENKGNLILIIEYEGFKVEVYSKNVNTFKIKRHDKDNIKQKETNEDRLDKSFKKLRINIKDEKINEIKSLYDSRFEGLETIAREKLLNLENKVPILKINETDKLVDTILGKGGRGNLAPKTVYLDSNPKTSRKLNT